MLSIRQYPHENVHYREMCNSVAHMDLGLMFMLSFQNLLLHCGISQIIKWFLWNENFADMALT